MKGVWQHKYSRRNISHVSAREQSFICMAKYLGSQRSCASQNAMESRGWEFDLNMGGQMD